MGNPHQGDMVDDTFRKFEKIREQIEDLQRKEKHFKTLLATIHLHRNEEWMSERLLDLKEKYSKVHGYNFQHGNRNSSQG